MIAKLMVAVCDICGHTEPAKYTVDCKNEDGYTIPDGWKNGKQENVHICPSCAKKLNMPLR